jgi:hypothetical protein
MAITIENTELERLIEQIANADGISVIEVLQESLDSLITLRGVNERRATLEERLAELAREVDAIPPRVPPDNRSADEVLGYNEYGVW